MALRRGNSDETRLRPNRVGVVATARQSDFARVLEAPPGERDERLDEGRAERRQAVFDPQGDLGENPALNEPESLEAAQLFREFFLRDGSDDPLKLAEPED